MDTDLTSDKLWKIIRKRLHKYTSIFEYLKEECEIREIHINAENLPELLEAEETEKSLPLKIQCFFWKLYSS